jgi:F-box and WD-40 domain protein 1/11
LNRQLLTPDYQLEDRESGIGIAVTEYQDSSIDRVDFIARLPNELAIQILEKLDHHSLARTALVSKTWHQVSCDNQIWRGAFLREKSKTYAMSGPIQPGIGLGVPSLNPNHDFKDLYRIRQELERNWLEGTAEPIYLNGHLDSIYCVQFDE